MLVFPSTHSLLVVCLLLCLVILDLNSNLMALNGLLWRFVFASVGSRRKTPTWDTSPLLECPGLMQKRQTFGFPTFWCFRVHTVLQWHWPLGQPSFLIFLALLAPSSGFSSYLRVRAVLDNYFTTYKPNSPFKKWSREFPRGPVVRTLYFHAVARVQYLVGELRSRKPHGQNSNPVLL